MDGRGRQGNNPIGPSSAPPSMMSSSYSGYPGLDSSTNSPYTRDRFWSTPNSSDPWGGSNSSSSGGNGGGSSSSNSSYTPQLDLSSFSASSAANQSYIPYGAQTNGSGPAAASHHHQSSSLHNVSSSGAGPGELTFSGPSPPNPLQPISVSSSPYPPAPSPCRQFTGPTSHGLGAHAKTPVSINGNGINGNSSGSSNSGSPPHHNSHNNSNNSTASRPAFPSYLNAEEHHHQSHNEPPNGSIPNGHAALLMHKSEMNGSLGENYLQPQARAMSAGRYPGELKGSEGPGGDPVHQYHQHQQHHHQQQQHQHHYYQGYGGGYHQSSYGGYPQQQQQQHQDSAAGYPRPYDPYQVQYGGGGGTGAGAGGTYPPPPSAGDYHHTSSSDFSHERSSSSSTDPGKTVVGDLKIDSSPTKEPLQQQQQNQSKLGPHDAGPFGAGETHGGARTFEASAGLMSLSNAAGNSSHHPPDSSSCSSQSPSSFDIQFGGSGHSHSVQQQQQQVHGPSPLGRGTSPSKLDDNGNGISEKMRSPIDSQSVNNNNNNNNNNSILGGKHDQQQQMSKGGGFLSSNSPSLNNSPKEPGSKSSNRKSSCSGSPPNEDVGGEQQQGGKGEEGKSKGTTPAKKKRKKKQPAAKGPGGEKVEKESNNGSSKDAGNNGFEFGGSGGIKVKEEPKEEPGKGKKGGRLGDEEDGDPEGSWEESGGDPEDKKDLKDVPMVECGCFPADEVHAEPGPFYTHLGAAHNLVELRKIIENRTGFRGNQVRLEKVIYTGKEGKTSHGCPLAKWILRRGSYEEQLLFLVKHRKGHKCATAWIVVCCVIWEGVPPHFADNLYDTVVYKLNRFGIPTTRRSDTNEQRSCACQGVDPDTCGAAYSFGCAWSMFFNGCKYARSRNVRKFRLTEEHEESELEEKVQHLATHLGPLYDRVAPDSYTNQIDHENEGLECRLGYRPGRPFSGVTVCLDYCSHAHKDAHNMMNGCTVTVSLTRNRAISKGDDEQYHVLPLYKLDETDEHGSKEGQKQKVKKGQLEILKKFPCKVRIRKVPLLPSRRRAKGKQGANSTPAKGEPPLQTPTPTLASPSTSSLSTPLKSHSDFSDMPPAKREKLFDDRLPNGTTGAGGSVDSQFGEPRYHASSYPPTVGNQASGMNSYNNEPPSSSWNNFGPPTPTRTNPTQPQNSGASNPSSFSSYYDLQGFQGPTNGPPNPNSFPSPSNNGSSLTSLTELTNNTTMTRHGSNSNLTSLSSSGSSNNILSSPGSSSGNPGSASSGYSSMSPILPSFRNTFMTEGESMGMMSAMSSPGSTQADSTSSPRSKGSRLDGGNNPQQQQSHGPASNTQQHSLGGHGFGAEGSPYGYPSQGYPGGSGSSGPPPPPGGIYHPQPHNPCLPPSHLGPPPPFSTSSIGSYGSPGAGGFGHHLPDSHYGMGVNPLGSWNPGYSSANYSPYGGYPPPPPPPQPMGGLGMGVNSTNFPSHPMSQYNPYQSRMGPQQQLGSGSWGAPAIGPFTPPGMPNMNLNMHHPSQHGGPQPPPNCFVTPPKPKVIPEVNESFSDNEECFKDSQMGGVAIALTHGSVILQCAKHEMHATTALKSPNRMYPSRICLIFYQHKSMNNRFHGWSEWEKKIEAKKLQEVKLINQGKMEASPRKMKQLIKEGYIQDNQ